MIDSVKKSLIGQQIVKNSHSYLSRRKPLHIMRKVEKFLNYQLISFYINDYRNKCKSNCLFKKIYFVIKKMSVFDFL